MKDLETQKREQEELKKKFTELVDFINSEEYFTLSDRERKLINQQRTGMETYLNALTYRIYGEETVATDSSILLPLMLSMMIPTLPMTPNSNSDYIKSTITETEEIKS